MTTDRSRGPDEDEALLAELFDTLLQAVLDGETPDLQALLPDRPDLQARVKQTFELACSVAGRREPGRPVLGGYEILRELGRGGMGTVYLARHEDLSREVAIKVLPQSLALSPRAKRRFLDEARTLARLRHDNIVHIHRIVDHSEMLAFEMEFIDGPSLQTLLTALRTQGPQPQTAHLIAALGEKAANLPVRSTVEYFVKLGIAIGRALAEVHRQGLVHRDVKPSNILLRPDGTPVLADFGLARDGDLAITQTGAFAGTPTYAAPERLRDGDLGLDGRADVYSLGATLYEAISLTPPYQGRSTQEVLRKIENGIVVPLRQRAPYVSRDLQTVLGKAMETDPKQRYATAAEFADDLERLLTLQPIRARPRGLVRRMALFAKRQRKTLVGAAAGAVLVAATVWPLLDAVEAAAAAREDAARTVHAARELFLEPECMGFAAGREIGGAFAPPELAAQVQALRKVQAEYDRALSSRPDDELVALEGSAVRTAIWLRTASPSGHQHLERSRQDPHFGRAADGLPPLARSLATQLMGGRVDVAALRTSLLAASPPERFATGLLGSLLGEKALCELAWTGLDEADFEHPLLDAGLGMLAAADGSHERAYPRLFHATRTFPASRALQFELADAALAQGDATLAQQWLEENDVEAARTARQRLLAADVLVAIGKRDEAEPAYRDILRRWPSDSTSRLRLARLAIDRGDLHRAREHITLLLQRSPERADARLDLARVALHERDRADYLHHARYALSRILARTDSRGVTRDLVEILRLGGLLGLVAELGDHGGRFVDWRHVQPPADMWRSPEQLRDVENLLRVLASYDQGVREMEEIDVRVISQMISGIYRAALDHRTLLAPLSPIARLGFALMPLALLDPSVQRKTSLLMLPFQSSLGDPVRTIPIDRIVPLLPATQRQDQLAAIITLGPVDGSEELLTSITPTGATGSAGIVRLHAGSDGRVLHELQSPGDDAIFGHTLCDVGDIDLDGFHDFAVGAPLRRRGEAGRDGGSVTIYGGNGRAPIREFHGSGIGFGVAIANLGDIDQDGVPDLAIGTSPELRNSTAQGEVSAFSGRSGALLYTVRSDRAGVWFGASIATTADLDGDGCRDLVVGGNHGGAQGLVRVFSGRNGEFRFDLEDDGECSDFGRSVHEYPDMDGDKIPELAVCAPDITGQPPRPGRVLLFGGRTGDRIGTLVGEHPGDLFGFSFCTLPDWSGNGRPTVAVGAVRQGVTGNGYVRVFDAATRTPLQSFYVPSGWMLLGMRIAWVGDRSGKGRNSIAASVAGPKGYSIMRFSYTPEAFR